jgi:hypothetical protein
LLTRAPWAVAVLAVLLAVFAGPAPATAKGAKIVSEFQGTRPAVSGLDLQVVGGDKFLLLRNGTGKQVIVKGYEDEPYLRFLPTRVVEVNTHAPSKYANEDRYALTPLPAQADSSARPKWQVISRDGSYRWFDHRIHSMEKGTPPQVKDENVRTKIFNWAVPMSVAGARVNAVGRLEWVPEDSSGSSTGLIVALAAAVILLLAALAFAITRRRRPRPAPATGAPPAEDPDRSRREAVDEAW